MLGMFNLFPFLQGWAYKEHTAERSAVVRGASPITCIKVRESGWIYAVKVATDDAYGTIRLEYQGGDLEPRMWNVNPEYVRSLGSFAQDPWGWASKYYRPNPHSTSGEYYMLSTGGLQGSPYPYKPTAILRMYLDQRSTQETAYIYANAAVIAITDVKRFIGSLRRVLKADASLVLDKALTTLGPQSLEDLPNIIERMEKEKKRR